MTRHLFALIAAAAAGSLTAGFLLDLDLDGTYRYDVALMALGTLLAVVVTWWVAYDLGRAHGRRDVLDAASAAIRAARIEHERRPEWLAVPDDPE